MDTAFDAESEDQVEQQERRHDEEEAKTDEQAAEILPPLGRRQGGPGEGLEAQSQIRWRDPTFQFLRDPAGQGLGVPEIARKPSDSGGVPEAVGPHLSPGRQSDEGFRCSSPLLPVGFVLVPNWPR